MLSDTFLTEQSSFANGISLRKKLPESMIDMNGTKEIVFYVVIAILSRKKTKVLMFDEINVMKKISDFAPVHMSHLHTCNVLASIE